MTNILLTGATGFVGKAVADKIYQKDTFHLSVVVRNENQLQDYPNRHLIPDLNGHISWKSALDGVEVVIHAAARVHVMQESSSDPLTEFRKANVEGTLNLARQAAEAGVRRFIFISSIKVNGERTQPGKPFRPDDDPAPKDAYGVSKMEAERALLELSAKVDMDVVIIRPVLVYGPGVKANFLNMMKWLNSGVPLPLGAIHNKRSLVALDNLVSLILTCIEHPAAGNNVFLVSDGEDLSTTQLLRSISNALNRKAILLPVPLWALKMAAVIFGRREFSRRLCSSLQVDIGKTCDLLNWRPEIKVDQAILKTTKHFLESRK
ncbi:SDR family oxidoreductase [Pseudomonas sp. H9]|uniref:UDP-glucose 4-epimerase family protein n=1 Tax=Pseudomonas sp. H9 TaxID=483968 RepID=UPI0010580BAA|nr:SDR family oxidoreductase [Pseudomonas sp. H9]TDF81205.1 SDR family oxidoreductase [Pseudomonas sp. H9]